MADRAPITPKVLAWARKSARISIEEAARKADVRAERVTQWENGECLPTITQAKELAKAYRRPFALFFLPDIPTDFQPLQDFRKPGSLDLSTASLFLIREIQQKHAWIGTVNEESGEERIPFVGRFTLNDDVEKVAADLLDTLGIDPSAYEKANRVLEWVRKAEAKGIFVSRTSFYHTKLTIDPKELQGFAIADPYAPFVFLNTADWKAPQLFTLVHELAHLWVGKSGISNESDSGTAESSSYHQVELFCNAVAACALMPRKIFLNLPNVTFTGEKTLYLEAKKYGVSQSAFLVRSLNLGLIEHSQYLFLKKEVDIAFSDFLEKDRLRKAKRKSESDSPPLYFQLALNKNGRLFTQTVLDAYRSGSVEPTLASGLLNVKLNKFYKLEEQLYR